MEKKKKTGIIHKDVGGNGIGDLFFVLDTSEDNGSATVADNTAMVIKNNGNVGIGTDNPNATIHGSGTNATTLRLNNTSSSLNYIQMDNSAGTNYIQGNAGSIGLLGVDDVRLIIGSTIRMKVDTNSRISLSNNDGNTSNTVFGKTAFTNAAGAVLGNVGADYNTIIGELAMGGADTTTATDNVAIGYYSLRLATSASSNVSIGSTSMRAMVGGARMLVLGTMQ